MKKRLCFLGYNWVMLENWVMACIPFLNPKTSPTSMYKVTNSCFSCFNLIPLTYTKRNIQKYTQNKNTQQLQHRILMHFVSAFSLKAPLHPPVWRTGDFLQGQEVRLRHAGWCDQSQLHWNEGRCTQMW